MIKQEQIWKALADPTRREMLDILRQRPHTTGELCKEFADSMTRYGVMKHLTILNEAELVIIRREGKFRWNHLNAVPIRSIYERWVKPFEEHWAANALSLKKFVESDTREDPEKDTTKPSLTGKGAIMSDQSMRSIAIKESIEIKAPVAKVWEALIKDIGSWWHSDFYAIPGSEIKLEPHVGGRLFEKAADGSEGLWYSVNGFYPEQSIEMAGFLRPEYGGPSTSLLKLSLEARGDVTVLHIDDAIFGVIGAKTEGSVAAGWRTLFGDGLKKYVETGKR